MQKKAASIPPRRRRTAEEARTAILDAAEQRLVESGPAGIRLQEVAADVGVSHPTVLHHFGNREGLVKAVVARALDSLHARLLEAVADAPTNSNQSEAMIDAVYAAFSAGHARAFLWLALSGYAPTMEELHVRSLAEAVHQVRRTRHAEMGKRVPPFEDTYFTVLLPALSLLTMSVVSRPEDEDGTCGSRRFRAWLARLVHEHLEQGSRA
jgi:AcrR family transcriptional regulator